jgi:polysaccharide pyruvyl transferase WcaK-like protein
MVLSGGYDTKNVGDYAMLALLNRVLEGSGYGLRLLTRHRHDFLRSIYGVEELIGNYEYVNKQEARGKMFRGFNHSEDGRHLLEIRRQLAGSAGLLIGGGRLLIDHTLGVMRGPLPYFATLVTLCRFLGVPVHVYALTVVPNRTPEGTGWLRFIIDNAARVSLRDQESVEVLHMAGCLREDLAVLPDPAYALGWERIREAGGPRLAGLTVRKIGPSWGGVARADHLSSLAGAVRELHQRGYRVIGIPHQYYGIDDPEVDDRTILRELAALAPLVPVEEEMLDLASYRRLYSSLDLLVGIRRHSFIFAAVTGVPVLPLAENPNASRAAREIGAGEPLPPVFEREEFARRLNALEAEREERTRRQEASVRGLAAGLEERYRSWLLG